MNDEPQDWVLAEGSQGGSALSARFRAQPSTAAERAARPLLIVITWGYDGDRRGLPDAAAAAAMERFEDAVFGATDSGRIAAEPVAVITSDGVREFRLYAADPDLFMDGFNTALEAHEAYPIELEMFEDPDWAAHAELLD